MGGEDGKISMINMGLIISLTLNLTLNQMKEKNTDMNTSMKHSYKLLKYVDVSVKILKCEIQSIFIYSILQDF